MGFWATWLSPIISVIGAGFTLTCAIFGGQSKDQTAKHLAEVKAAEHWDKNSCNLVFSTASGGRRFDGYSYEAKGDDLICNDMPQRRVIEKTVDSCVQKYRSGSHAAGCCGKTIGKSHWQIRVSKDLKRHPLAKITC